MIWLAIPVAIVLSWLVASVLVNMRQEGFSLSVSILPLFFKPSWERVEDDLFFTAANVQLCLHSPEIQFKLEQVEYEAISRGENERGEHYRRGWTDGYEHRRLEMAALNGDTLTLDELDELFGNWDTESEPTR